MDTTPELLVEAGLAGSVAEAQLLIDAGLPAFMTNAGLAASHVEARRVIRQGGLRAILQKKGLVA